MSALPFYCLAIVAMLLSSWGVGGLMAAVGNIRGWNTKRTFWISAIGYASLMIGQFLIFWYANDILHVSFAYEAATILSIGLLIIGIVLSPLIHSALKRRYLDTFKKPMPSRAIPVSHAQAAVDEESRRQKQQPVSSSKDLEFQPEPAAPSVSKPVRAASSGHIFVSYRRSDSADIAGRIYDRLIGKFGKAPVFKDVDSIPLGLDFKEYLDMKVGECNVLLAIIGDRWLEASDASGNKRLEDPTDFVRIEIESALERGVPVIPLLVRDAIMPREENLPSGLRKLVYRNGIPIRPDPDFHRDMDRLISALEKYIG